MESPDLAADPIAEALLRDERVARKAFDRLVCEYGAPLTAFAFRLSGDRDVAHDVVQDVFVWAWERRALLAQVASLRAYLYGAVRHRIVDFARRERRVAAWRTEPDGRAPGMGALNADPAASLERDELTRVIAAALATLPPRTHQIATLRWKDGLLPAEIASVLGISVSTVGNTLISAAKALRTSLVGYREHRTG